ncbi:PRC-barrel domain-containing protein [Roseicella frigidaeris]|uniref:PRC-barrel domain-containing protein n=1 Tax=Roseicella frigidaeris TaxID=2230885 RepID=A0A327MDL4_9PROT|nr:PRC-barrel domain-containing protein [Roseicella frigidaeris]RAI61080.1 hypothetical protein DOO78_02855 [Roseicella frigidaeris]
MHAAETGLPPWPWHTALPRPRPTRPGHAETSHRLVLCCLLGCLLGWATTAQAQDKPAAEKPAPPPAQPERIEKGSVLRLLGREVKGTDGETVAQIVNVVIDPSGEPRAVILDFGGFLGVGKRRIAVAWRALTFSTANGQNTITLTLDRDQLKNFPDYKPDGPVIVATPPQDAVGQPAGAAPASSAAPQPADPAPHPAPGAPPAASEPPPAGPAAPADPQAAPAAPPATPGAAAPTSEPPPVAPTASPPASPPGAPPAAPAPSAPTPPNPAPPDPAPPNPAPPDPASGAPPAPAAPK